MNYTKNEKADKEDIERTIAKLEEMSIEQIANSLLNSSIYNFNWENTKPFEMHSIGTHASYEKIYPNPNDVYNDSPLLVRKKMIDSLDLLIEGFGDYKKLDFLKLPENEFYGYNIKNDEEFIFHVGRLIINFSGNENHWDSSGYNPSIEEKNLELREYFIDKISNSLKRKIEASTEIEDTILKKCRFPEDLLDETYWTDKIMQGYGATVYARFTSNYSIFREKKEKSTNIDYFVKHGFLPEHLDKYLESFGNWASLHVYDFAKWINDSKKSNHTEFKKVLEKYEDERVTKRKEKIYGKIEE